MRNEALFREVNERIKEINQGLGATEEADFICECGRDECTAPMTLTLTEYEAVRRNPLRFAVVPGHEISDFERLVSKNDRFAVVAKPEAAAAEIDDVR